MADHLPIEPEAQIRHVGPTLQHCNHQNRTLCLISVLLVHAGKSAWHEPAMHAAEPGEHSPAALFQRGFVSIEGRLGVALGGVNRLDLNRAPAARVKGAAEQLGTGRGWDGAPLSRQASQQELDRGGSLWMWMRHELFG